MSLNLIFDLDDTLYDLAEPFRRSHIDLFAEILGEDCSELFRMSRVYSDEILELEKLGKIPSEDTFYHRIKRTYADVGIDMDRELADRFEEKYRYYQKHITVPEGIKVMLDDCAEAGFSMALLTNGKVKGQGNKIKALDMYRWFIEDRIFISEVTGFIKPDLEVFRYAEEKLGLKPEEIWYVGDTYEADVLGAKRAGWNVIWYNHRKRQISTENNAADITVYTAEELNSAIKNLENKEQKVILQVK